MQDVVVGRKDHQHHHQTEPNPETHLLGALRQRSPPNDFDRIEQKVTTIEERDREEIEEPDRDRQHGSELDHEMEAHAGRLAGQLRDAQHAADIPGITFPHEQ